MREIGTKDVVPANNEQAKKPQEEREKFIYKEIALKTQSIEQRYKK